MCEIVEMAKVLEGVGFDPVDFCFEVRVESEIRIGGFERSTAGVNAGDVRADLGEMQSEAAVVGADVESLVGAAGGGDERGGGSIIQALVEEGSGLLAGSSVVMEMEI